MIRENREVIPRHFLLTMGIEGDYPPPAPGQFVMLRVTMGTDPLLRRPFSVHRFRKEGGGVLLALLYRLVGRGTEMLARLQGGSEIRVSAPLGTGFHIPAEMKRLYVVAGGVGVAPLAYLVQSWGKRGKEGEVVAYLGAKSQAGLLGIDELKPWCSRVEVATDDGSQGFFGTVVAAFQRDLPHITDEETALYVCGPRGMVRQMASLLHGRAIYCQVSLEEQMACGIGACLGCVIAVRNRMGKTYYRRICADGPVFNLHHVIWEE